MSVNNNEHLHQFNDKQFNHNVVPPQHTNDQKNIYKTFFKTDGSFVDSVPQSMRRQDHVRKAFNSCYRGENKKTLYLQHFGVEYVEEKVLQKDSSIFQKPFSIVNGFVAGSVPTPWAIHNTSISKDIAKMAFRFVLQYTKIIDLKNSTNDFEVQDNYPAAFVKISASLTRVLSNANLKLRHSVPSLQSGLSASDARLNVWRDYIKKSLEEDHYIVLQVLTIPVKWKNVLSTPVETPFGNYLIATAVSVESLPKITKPQLPEFASYHGGGAQVHNSDYLYGCPMKDKYMDKLAGVYMLSRACEDVSVIAGTSNNFINRYTFDHEVDLTGTAYDTIADLTNPIQIGTNDRTLERVKRTSIINKALSKGIALKVVFIDELIDDYNPPEGYAFARYPVPHQSKVVIFKKGAFDFKQITLNNAVSYTVVGLIARQYRWAGYRTNLVTDISLKFRAEIVESRVDYQDVSVDPSVIFANVVGPYDLIKIASVKSEPSVRLNPELASLSFTAQGKVPRLATKTDSDKNKEQSSGVEYAGLDHKKHPHDGRVIPSSPLERTIKPSASDIKQKMIQREAEELSLKLQLDEINASTAAAQSSASDIYVPLLMLDDFNNIDPGGKQFTSENDVPTSELDPSLPESEQNLIDFV